MRAVLLFLSFFVLAVLPQKGQAEHTNAKQAILVDYDTGMVLFEKESDARMTPSSMSKVMTMYMVFEALRDGKFRLDTELPVSEKAWRKGGSKMFVEVGSRVPVEDLIRGVIIQSGNDATIVLAEGLAGSESEFAQTMTVKAAELGMADSHFANASGWPDPEHYTTARDLATLATRIIRDFPDHYSYYSEKEFTYNEITQKNRNPLLYRDGLGADGIKTGHTEAGGYGLMASGTRDGRRVVLVVNGLTDEKARAQESARLLEWGLKGFENVTLFESGAPVTEAEIAMGKEKTVSLTTAEDITVTLPLAEKEKLKVEVLYTGPLIAPLNTGQEAGVLRIDIPGIGVTEVPLVTAASVEKAGLFTRAFEKLKMMTEQKSK